MREGGPLGSEASAVSAALAMSSTATAASATAASAIDVDAPSNDDAEPPSHPGTQSPNHLPAPAMAAPAPTPTPMTARVRRFYNSIIFQNFAIYLASGAMRRSSSFEAQLFGARTIETIDSMIESPMLQALAKVSHVPRSVARHIMLALIEQDFSHCGAVTNDFFRFAIPSPSVDYEVKWCAVPVFERST